MKPLLYIAAVLFLSASVTSCATATEVSKKEIAGYTLKNKKELMQQKILRKQEKTVVAQP